jgi:hypothetical protein
MRRLSDDLDRRLVAKWIKTADLLRRIVETEDTTDDGTNNSPSRYKRFATLLDDSIVNALREVGDKTGAARLRDGRRQAYRALLLSFEREAEGVHRQRVRCIRVRRDWAEYGKQLKRRCGCRALSAALLAAYWLHALRVPGAHRVAASAAGRVQDYLRLPAPVIPIRTSETVV